MSHTPGPWELLTDHCGPHRMNYIIRRSADLEELRPISFVGDYPEMADALLMTAAPDLFAELVHLVYLLAPLEKSGQLQVPGLATLNGARAAIAKASEVPTHA